MLSLTADFLSIFLIHLFPFLQLLYSKIDVANILLLYWMESFMILIFCVLKMKALKNFCIRIGKIPFEDTVDRSITTQRGSKPAVLQYKKNGVFPPEEEFDVFIQRRLFPNKIFLAVHGLIILFLISLNFKFNVAFNNIYFLLFSFLFMGSRQIFSYNTFTHNNDAQSKTSFQQLQNETNFRLAGLQLTIIFGIFLVVYGAQQSAFAYIVVVWEFLTDVGILLYKRRRSLR